MVDHADLTLQIRYNDDDGTERWMDFLNYYYIDDDPDSGKVLVLKFENPNSPQAKEEI